jgi:hypothetical protein
MTSTQDIVLGVAAYKKQRRTEKRHRPKRTCKPGKKRLHILLDDTKKAFDGWEDLPEPWTFRLVRNTLNGATLVRIFHMTATSSIGGRIRPTCIIASGQFSRKDA